MKILKYMLACVGLSVMLVGCSAPQPQEVTEVSKSNVDRFNGINDDIEIITDSETGCKYIYVTSGLGNSKTATVSPLFGSDGEVEGCKK